MKDLKNDIKQNSFKRVYLFYGLETYLSAHYENRLKETLVDSGNEAMNLDIYTGKTVSSDTVADACTTLPFLNDKRLVIVRDSKLFVSGRKDETEKMCSVLDEVPDTTVLLFVETEADKRSKLFKKINSTYKAVEFKTPTDAEMVKWIAQICRKNNIKISPETAAYFIRTVASGMASVKNELDKLISFHAQAKTAEIQKAGIDAICTRSLEARVFDLVAAVADKKTAQALSIYNQLLHMKESPIMILSMIGRQFRIILKSKLLQESGATPTQIAETLSQRSFVIKDCLRQSQNFDLDTLYQAVEDCLDTDIRIKTGQMNDKLAVETLIIQYARKQ